MRNKIVLLILMLIGLKVFTQEESTSIYGNVISNSLDLENIHVLNKNSKLGTITDTYGKFKIKAKENDTIIFSGIQFYYLEYPVQRVHITSKTMTVDLVQKINELEEVTVKHNLIGNLAIDGGNLKDSISKINKEALDFSNIDLSLVSNINDEFSRSRTSNNSQLMPSMNPNLLVITSLILTPIVKQVSKIGATKRNIKKYERNFETKIQNAPEKIRTVFGDSFFIETLEIPKENIEDFIAFCLPKGIAYLFVENKKIEMIEMFLEESKLYKNNLSLKK